MDKQEEMQKKINEIIDNTNKEFENIWRALSAVRYPPKFKRGDKVKLSKVPDDSLNWTATLLEMTFTIINNIVQNEDFYTIDMIDGTHIRKYGYKYWLLGEDNITHGLVKENFLQLAENENNNM